MTLARPIFRWRTKCVDTLERRYQLWTCPGFVEGWELGIRRSDLTAYCPPVSRHSSVRPQAEPFFRPGPHDAAAVARSGGQGRPPLAAARRACP
jgi:hypothetical protein